MLKPLPFTAFLPLAVLSFLSVGTCCADITWISSGTFSTNSVQLTQNLVYAVNVGSSSAVVDSATGVTFGADDGSNFLESATNGVSSAPVFLPSGTTGDTAFDGVLNTGDFPSNFVDPIVYTLENLTIGETYTVELLLADTRAAFNGRTFTASQSNGGSPSITQTYAFADGTTAVGGFALGTFTADATTEAFQILNQDALPPAGDGHFVGGQLNGVMLVQSTPEPSSILLLVSVVGAIFIGCRHKVRRTS